MLLQRVEAASKDSSRESSPERGQRDPREIQRAALSGVKLTTKTSTDALDDMSRSMSSRLHRGLQSLGSRLGAATSGCAALESVAETKVHSSPRHAVESE